MSVRLPVDILGLAGIQAHAEYTQGPVVTEYNQALQPFIDVFNLDPSVADAQITAATAGQFTTSISAFRDLAQNGRTDPADPGDFIQVDRVWHLSIQMASSIDELLRSLQAAGAPVDGTALTEQQVKNWYNLSYNSNAVKEILTRASAVGGEHNRTLQALTELIYVKTGNEILSDSLEQLENALTSTKDVINTLNELQRLHNQIQAIDKQSFNDFLFNALGVSNRLDKRLFDVPKTVQAPTVTVRATGSLLGFTLAGGVFVPTVTNFNTNVTTITNKIVNRSDPSLFALQIPSLASQHFGEIVPQLPDALKASLGTAITDFLELRERIRLHISELAPSAVTPRLPDGSEDPQSLLGQLRVVFSDIGKALSATGNNPSLAVVAWILDNYKTTSTNASGVEVKVQTIAGFEPGQIQENLTDAISAGQNFNDKQKEEVRRFLFLFEEYYKSASAILTKLTQIIEKIAQGISR